MHFEIRVHEQDVRPTWAQGEGAAVIGNNSSFSVIHSVSYKFSNSWVGKKGKVVHDEHREVEQRLLIEA